MHSPLCLRSVYQPGKHHRRRYRRSVLYVNESESVTGRNCFNGRAAALQRNRSFTKEEIEAYRRSKKKAEEELRAAASSPADGTQVSCTPCIVLFVSIESAIDMTFHIRKRFIHCQDQYMSGDAGSECERLNFMEMKTDAWEKLIKDSGW